MPHSPELSVVFATHERPQRLRALLDSLRGQEAALEVVAVDDASGPETAEVLDAERERGDLDLRVVRHDESLGPAHSRNAGWRAARAPTVVFMDDDCTVAADWGAAMTRAVREHPDAIVAGRLDPNPDELEHYNPFAHTYQRHELGVDFATWNTAYPRALLERLGGFDGDSFPVAAGEDTDLGWRALEAGARAVYVDEPRAFHAVERVGALRRFKIAWRQTVVVQNFRRHPGLREARIKGLFWRWNHYLLARFLLALVLPRRFALVRVWLAAPYVDHLTARRTGPLLAPYMVALDVVETAAIVRGAIRYRTLVI
jgi:GT2 family glycosyltransferase